MAIDVSSIYRKIAEGNPHGAIQDLLLHVALLDSRIEDLRQQYALLQQDVSEMKARELVAERSSA